MGKRAQDLSRDELNELKRYLFSNEDVPDEIFFEYYDGIYFVDQDFLCNIKDGDYENCGAAYQDLERKFWRENEKRKYKTESIDQRHC